MSVAWPWAPPIGWCMWMVELGKAYLFPLAPPDSRIVAMLAVMPRQMVDTSGLISRMVS